MGDILIFFLINLYFIKHFPKSWAYYIYTRVEMSHKYVSACCWAMKLLFREKFTPEMLSREVKILGQTTTPGNSFALKGRDIKRGPRG